MLPLISLQFANLILLKKTKIIYNNAKGFLKILNF